MGEAPNFPLGEEPSSGEFVYPRPIKALIWGHQTVLAAGALWALTLVYLTWDLKYYAYYSTEYDPDILDRALYIYLTSSGIFAVATLVLSWQLWKIKGLLIGLFFAVALIFPPCTGISLFYVAVLLGEASRIILPYYNEKQWRMLAQQPSEADGKASAGH